MKVTKQFKVLMTLLALTSGANAKQGDTLAGACFNSWGSDACRLEVAAVCNHSILHMCGVDDACELVDDSIWTMCEAFGLDEEQAILKALITK